MSSSDCSDEEIMGSQKSKLRKNALSSESEAESVTTTDSSTDQDSGTTVQADSPKIVSRNKPDRKISTSVVCVEFTTFKEKLERMVAEHKVSLKRMREQERANYEEMFALLTYRKTGELAEADNVTKHQPILHDGVNLLQIPAGHSAAKFGRHLAGVMYGKDEDCKLMHHIIGVKRRRRDVRTPVPEEEREKFELVVRSKYPKFPETAYNEARHAANQMGLDLKLKKMRKNRSALQ